MSEYIKIPTSAEVYAVIFTKHRDSLRVFSSFSDPEGRFHGGIGEKAVMETSWGFESSDYPIMEVKSSWGIDPEAPRKRVDQKHEYWLCVAIKEANND